MLFPYVELSENNIIAGLDFVKILFLALTSYFKTSLYEYLSKNIYIFEKLILPSKTSTVSLNDLYSLTSFGFTLKSSLIVELVVYANFTSLNVLESSCNSSILVLFSTSG